MSIRVIDFVIHFVGDRKVFYLEIDVPFDFRFKIVIVFVHRAHLPDIILHFKQNRR